MKLRNVVGATVGAGTLLAAANRAVASRAPDLEPPLGRPQETYRWRGFDVAYTEAGDAADPDLVLLHGINVAASSHEFSRVVDALAEEHHVVAPDLPGFGGSDRPAMVYSGPLYVTFVADFLRDVADEPRVVASSLTGGYAAVASTENELSVEDLVLVCPTTDSMPWRRVWLRELLRFPVVGEALFNLVASKPSIRKNLADHGFADPAHVTEEWVEYDWAAAHQPGARYAPASFLAGFLDLDDDLGATLADRDDVTLVWGRKAETTPLSAGRDLAERADARLLVFDGADLLPHAEFPEQFVDVVLEG